MHNVRGDYVNFLLRMSVAGFIEVDKCYKVITLNAHIYMYMGRFRVSIAYLICINIRVHVAYTRVKKRLLFVACTRREPLINIFSTSKI